MTKILKKLLHKLTTEYRHAFLLLYWALFGIVFWSMEAMVDRNYFSVSSPLDSMIPFNEWFLIPYYIWFLYIILDMVYFFFRDKEAFVKYMLYLMITYSVTLIVYAVFPTSQPLRPNLTDEGFLFDVARWMYGYDTNTNVCPSIHVIGSFNVMFAAVHSKTIKSKFVKGIYIVLCILISVSTVFVKQHSIIDVFWGVVLSLLAYPLVFFKNKTTDKIVKFFMSPKRVVERI